MVAQRSLLFAAASAFTVSSVIAAPHHARHHAHHAKRQDKLELSYVTLYQTQPAGPNGTDIVYTMTSPVWVSAGSGATATGALPPLSDLPEATPVPVPSATSTADAMPSPSFKAEEAAVNHHTWGQAPASSAVVSSAAPVVPSVAPVVTSAAPAAPVVTSAAVVPVVSSAAAPVVPVVSSAAAPVASSAPETPSGGGSATGAYKEYSGTPSDYPAESEWLSFEAIFDAGKGDASKGMASYGITEDQMSKLSSGIKAAAASTGVDARIILAMALQETRGVATTGNGGLIQASNAGALCDGTWDTIQTQLECGLKSVYAECVAMYPESEPWVALRCYNNGSGVGSVTPSNLNLGPTPSYCTDIANRLTTGWTN